MFLKAARSATSARPTTWREWLNSWLKTHLSLQSINQEESLILGTVTNGQKELMYFGRKNSIKFHDLI